MLLQTLLPLPPSPFPFPCRSSLVCEWLGVALAWRAWVSTEGSSNAHTSLAEDASRALLCFLVVCLVDIACLLAALPATLSAAGPTRAWYEGMVPTAYIVGVALSAVALVVAAAGVTSVVGLLGKLSPAHSLGGGGGPGASGQPAFVAALASLLSVPRSVVGPGASGGGSTLVQNGVLVRGRPPSSLIPPEPEDRRLGTA